MATPQDVHPKWLGSAAILPVRHESERVPMSTSPVKVQYALMRPIPWKMLFSNSAHT